MTVADILVHLREHPEDARAVVEGLRKFAGPWDDTAAPILSQLSVLVEYEHPGEALASVGRTNSPPPEGHPLADRRDWFLGAVWWACPHRSWHATAAEARAAVEAHLRAHGWTVIPRGDE